MVETSLELLLRDLRDHAKSLSEIFITLADHDKKISSIESARALDRAVGAERKGNLDDRLDRIEESVDQVFRLGRWILAGIGSLFLAALANFVLRGGLLG